MEVESGYLYCVVNEDYLCCQRGLFWAPPRWIILQMATFLHADAHAQMH